MKAFAKVNRNRAMFIAALSLLMLTGSVSAFAVPPAQIARFTGEFTFTNQCCATFSDIVRVTEPTTVTPVIVTWSSEYILRGTVLFGLSVNNGPCKFYGPAQGEGLVEIAQDVSQFIQGTYQWVVFPSDGLVKGSNSFQVCGGGANESLATTIGSYTLAVQIGK